MAQSALDAKRNAFRDIPNNDGHLPWWKNKGMRQLNLVLVFSVYFAEILNGFDGSLTSSFQTYPSWKAAMGHPSSSAIGLLNAASYISGFLTLPFAAILVDRYGRRMCIRYAGACSIIGTAIGAAAGAGNTDGYAMFIVSRIIMGSGTAFALVISPIILQEATHPKQRTLLAGSYDCTYNIGAFIAAWVTFGCSHISSNNAWRIPYYLHLPAAITMAIVINFIPESPRWLIGKGREPEAVAFMVKYHANGAENDPLVEFELAEIKSSIEAEKNLRQDTWGELWYNRANRRRIATAVLIACCQNLSGTGIISYYYSSILKLVGVTAPGTLTGINAGLVTFTGLVGFSGVWVSQHFNRRPHFFISWTLTLCSNIGLIVATQQYVSKGSHAAGIVAIVFVWLYNASFWFSCGALFFSMPAEIMTYSMRAKGLMIWGCTVRALSIFSQYTNPVGMSRLGWKWYCFYTACIVFFGFIAYFLFPETRGFTLEEISELFDNMSNRDTGAYIDPHAYAKGVPVSANVSMDDKVDDKLDEPVRVSVLQAHD